MLAKRNNTFEVEILNNGYVLRLSGTDENGSWTKESAFVGNLEDMIMSIESYVSLKED